MFKRARAMLAAIGIEFYRDDIGCAVFVLLVFAVAAAISLLGEALS